MALRQKLPAPLVVEATDRHTHTVVFLHRFPECTTDAELPGKVLSSKMTRVHKTLGEQFPSVRWVFPFAKAGARPYGNLSAEEKHTMGLMPGGGGVPYITQVVLREADRVGGLDKVILGGQGETAVAAHEAMTSLPEPPVLMRGDKGKAEADFVRETYHNPTWTDVTHVALAGFVGMHGDDGVVTRDVARYAAATKDAKVEDQHANGRPTATSANAAVLLNTPHRFIRGGYKVQTATWDGRRIDEFAAFLADDVAVRREGPPVSRLVPGQELMSRSAAVVVVDAKAAALREQEKHAKMVAREKMEDEKRRDLVKVRIEADRVERKMREARERQARLRAKNAPTPPAATAPTAASPQLSSPQGRGGSTDTALWRAPSQVRGELSAAQQEALGLVKKER